MSLASDLPAPAPRSQPARTITNQGSKITEFSVYAPFTADAALADATAS